MPISSARSVPGRNRKEQIGVAGDRRHPRIGDDQLAAVVAAAPDVVGGDRRALADVGAGHEHYLRLAECRSRDSVRDPRRRPACRPFPRTPCRGGRCSRCAACPAQRAQTCPAGRTSPSSARRRRRRPPHPFRSLSWISRSRRAVKSSASSHVPCGIRCRFASADRAGGPDDCPADNA